METKRLDDTSAYEHELKGADAGLNPMFGEWRQRFDFPPVPYGAGGAKRAAFRKAIQDKLTNKFFFSSEVKLEITLHVDVQTVLETSDTADLDNYAKAILDGLKGPGGILLDDAQVQTLTISWLDNNGAEEPSFSVDILSSPDDFIMKTVEFFQMPDGLWYPQSRRLWSDGGQEDISARNHYTGLLIMEVMSSVKASGRHLLRAKGADRLTAYRQSMYFSSSSARGYHKSRIDDGFRMHDRKSWQAAFTAWKSENADIIASIEKILASVRINYTNLAKLIADGPPEDHLPHEFNA